MTKAISKAIASPKEVVATVAYDVSEQLRTPEEMAAYLDAWLEEAPEDATGIARARRHCTCQGHDAGGSRRRSESGELVQGPR